MTQHPAPSVHVLMVESAQDMGQSTCANALDRTVNQVSYYFLPCLLQLVTRMDTLTNALHQWDQLNYLL